MWFQGPSSETERYHSVYGENSKERSRKRKRGAALASVTGPCACRLKDIAVVPVAQQTGAGNNTACRDVEHICFLGRRREGLRYGNAGADNTGADNRGADNTGSDGSESAESRSPGAGPSEQGPQQPAAGGSGGGGGKAARSPANGAQQTGSTGKGSRQLQHGAAAESGTERAGAESGKERAGAESGKECAGGKVTAAMCAPPHTHAHTHPRLLAEAFALAGNFVISFLLVPGSLNDQFAGCL